MNAVKKQKYWFFITDCYCPQCGRTQKYYEKKLTPRPEKFEDRHEEIEAYDHCMRAD